MQSSRALTLILLVACGGGGDAGGSDGGGSDADVTHDAPQTPGDASGIVTFDGRSGTHVYFQSTDGALIAMQDTDAAGQASATVPEGGSVTVVFTDQSATRVHAIDREARAVAALAASTGGGVVRAATWTTALSQHCPCGARVSKSLADRVHTCSACGLRGDRDAVAAVLASFTVLVERGVAASARVDYDASRDALPEIRRALRTSYQGWQDTPSESTDLSARDGSCVTWRMSTPAVLRVARRNVGTASCATRNETGYRQTTSERVRVRTDRSLRYGPVWTYLRDKS